MSVNINRNNTDPFYRYKMPKLTAKIEGKGNGIKTVIPNMVDIAKALERPPTYPTKYLGIELGALCIMDEKAERYIVNGAFDADRLQELLDGFIAKFVLCPECDNPETRLRVTSKRLIEMKCIACGYRGIMKTQHKLMTYIVNHPPPVNKKKASRENQKEESSQAEGGDFHVEAPAIDDNRRDEEWSMETTEEAVRAREDAQLSGAVSRLVMAEDASKPIDDRLQIFHTFVKEKLELPKFPAKDVLSKAERLDCKEKGVLILAELLLDAEDLMSRLDVYKVLLQHFTHESKKTQKYLLGAVEKIMMNHQTLVPQTPQIFMKLYDFDIVEEPAFLSWSEKTSKKFVPKDFDVKIHELATPFITWLQEADEEDDEEDEDDEVDFDENVEGVEVEENTNDTVSAEVEEEEDIDIDDI